MKHNTRKKLITLLTTAAIAATALFCTFGAAACGAKSDFTVGILQYTPHASLDESNKGFQDELTRLVQAQGKTVSYVYKNALGQVSDCKSNASTLVMQNPDLILGIATPAAQACANETTKIPVLFTAVTDHIDAKLTNANVTGMTDEGPVEKQIILAGQLAKGKKIGLLWTTSESNSEVQLNQAKAVAEAQNISYKIAGITERQDVSATFSTLANDPEVGAIWAPTDNTIADATAALRTANASAKKPIVCGAISMTEECGVATYGIIYYDLGKKVAEMAYEILMNGKKPSDLPVGNMVEEAPFRMYQNNADEIGYVFPDEVKALANA